MFVFIFRFYAYRMDWSDLYTEPGYRRLTLTSHAISYIQNDYTYDFINVYFILDFYVNETYILTTDQLAATLMVYDDDNSSIVGVLVYTFSTIIHLPHFYTKHVTHDN